MLKEIKICYTQESNEKFNSFVLRVSRDILKNKIYHLDNVEIYDNTGTNYVAEEFLDLLDSVANYNETDSKIAFDAMYNIYDYSRKE